MRSEATSQRAALGRDFVTILAVVALSAGMAVAANLCWHKMDWLRADALRPPTPSTNGADAAAAADSGIAPLVPANGNEPTADDVLRHLHNGTARFVDAREEKEYAGGHLIGAINLPSSAVYDRITDVTSMVAPNEKIIVYCGGGQCEASHVVTGVLRDEFHYTNVQIYEKGWEEIQTSGKFSDCTATGGEP